MANLCVLTSENIESIILHAYFEAEQGSVSLALQRLQELADEFPSNGQIAFAQGFVLGRNLGEGLASYALFEKALNLIEGEYPPPYSIENYYFFSEQEKIYAEATAQNLRVVALFSLPFFAPNEEKFRFWTKIALPEQEPPLAGEVKRLKKMLKQLDNGDPYSEVLFRQGLRPPKTANNSYRAAQIDAAINSSELNQKDLEAHYRRAILLRLMDLEAYRRRITWGEVFPSDERLALQGAIKEIDKCIKIDEGNSVFWDFKAKWSMLLDKFDQAVYCGKKTQEARRFDFSFLNVCKVKDALATFREGKKVEAALNALCTGFLHSDLEKGAKKARSILNSHVDYFIDKRNFLITKIKRSTLTRSEYEMEKFNPSDKIMKDIWSYLNNQCSAKEDGKLNLLDLVVELLMHYTPESLFYAYPRVYLQDKSLGNSLVDSARYIIIHGRGVMQRDAARFLCLVPFWSGTEENFRKIYHDNILGGSPIENQELAYLKRTIENEMTCLNPMFSDLIR
jgi:hypothetical protein